MREGLIVALGALLTSFVGYLGLRMKNMLQTRERERIAESIARRCVRAVEQLYPNLHGPEKYEKASAGIREILAGKGIKLTDFELEMLIESCVMDMNKQSELFWSEIEQLRRIANGMDEEEL